MTSKYIPLFDRVLVRRRSVEERVGRIIVPDEAREKQTIGVIVAVGPLVKYVKEGDTIMFTKYGGNELEPGKEDSPLVMKEADILALVKEE